MNETVTKDDITRIWNKFSDGGYDCAVQFAIDQLNFSEQFANNIVSNMIDATYDAAIGSYK